MNTKPILFSTEMVQAILDGRKTQTRRIAPFDKNCTNPVQRPDGKWDEIYNNNPNPNKMFKDGWRAVTKYRPKFEIGDILWVRETFYVDQDCIQGSYAHEEGEPVKFPPHILEGGFRRCVQFKADYPNVNLTWKPSIFMPRSAARIFLKVTNVRCERLQDISEEDAKKEGMRSQIPVSDFKFGLEGTNAAIPKGRNTHYIDFILTWQKINGKKYPWDTNPWVWVYEFERTEKPEKFLS